MPVNPIVVHKARVANGQQGDSGKKSSRISGSHERPAAARTDQVDISREARALSGDTSLGSETLAQLQQLAHRTLDQMQLAEEQAGLVKAALGLGA